MLHYVEIYVASNKMKGWLYEEKFGEEAQFKVLFRHSLRRRYKLKLPPCLTKYKAMHNYPTFNKHHAMKMYWGVDV
jgi:hypothetical protein